MHHRGTTRAPPGRPRAPPGTVPPPSMARVPAPWPPSATTSSATSSTTISGPGATAASRRGSRPSRTATSTSATPSRSASTSGSRATTRARCNLRYDDTNPTKEDVEYVDSIERDVRWLGFEPSAVLFSADYFPRMYELAERLVTRRQGVRLRSRRRADQRVPRHAVASPAAPSPFRDRTVAENLALLRRMKAGELPDGACTLRAKIDMASAEHEDARSAALPDPPRAPPPHRRRVVHLPDVRLRASARGRDRGHHALDLHARVREQPRALRLGARPHRAVDARARTSTSSRGSRSTTR